MAEFVALRPRRMPLSAGSATDSTTGSPSPLETRPTATDGGGGGIADGAYYTDSWCRHHRESLWGGNDPSFFTGGKMSIIDVGGTAEWDELAQWVTAPGDGFAVYRWGVYEMDESTLMPTALLLDAGDHAYLVGGKQTVAISLTTTSRYIGLGIACVGTNPGASRPTFIASSVGQVTTNYTGFYPFGALDIPSTASDSVAHFALALTSTTTPRTVMAPPSAWTLGGSMSGVGNENVDSGLWIHRVA